MFSRIFGTEEAFTRIFGCGISPILEKFICVLWQMENIFRVISTFNKKRTHCQTAWFMSMRPVSAMHVAS
jgi:hypothetical protein